MSVRYEWDVETVAAVDGSDDFAIGDVIEHYHVEKYAEAKTFAGISDPGSGCKFEIVLVRDDDEGRSWAYIDDAGKLPECFHDASGVECAKVPKRFINEVEKGK